MRYEAVIFSSKDSLKTAHSLIEGVTYDSVGVRFKGLTSDFANFSQKKSFNISVDAFIKNQNVQGYKTLNLNSNFEDPSSMREIVYNHVGRNYTPGLKTNLAELYINGEYWGPYANVQQLNGEYIKEWFLSNDGTRWRALQKGTFGGPPPGGGGPIGQPGGVLGGPPIDIQHLLDSLGLTFADLLMMPELLDSLGISTIQISEGRPMPDDEVGDLGAFSIAFGRGSSTLNYLGPDTSDYIPNYTLKNTKKEDPWTDLVIGTDKLNNLPADNDLYDNLKAYLDVDRSLWFLAHEILFTDSDAYVSKGGMDYYVYWEVETGRLIPLEYDGNSCLQFESTGWSPFYREDEKDFPLMNRLFASPDLRQRYLAHFRTILADYFTVEYLDMLMDNYKAQLENLIQNDTKRITEPEKFAAEIEALKAHVRERRAVLLNNVEMNVQGLEIASVSTVTTAPYNGEAVVITTELGGDMGVDRVRLYYGTGLVGTFTRIDMNSNGNGIYSASIPGFEAGTYVRYYVEAIAANEAKTVTFAPKGAEHDVFFYRVNAGENTVISNVVINEFMASNKVTAMDQDGEFDDWIELFNTTNAAIDLTGYFLSDNVENLPKYDIPEGTTIAANGYLIVWADEDGMQEGLHANFKLSSSGETILLLNPDTVVIDEVTYGEQTADRSMARRPNGTGDFRAGAASFNANNDLTTSLNEVDFAENTLSVYPNPANSSFVLELKEKYTEEMQVKVFDVYGRLLHRQATPSNKMQLIVNDWADGLYFIVVNDRIGKKVLVAK